MQVSCSSTAYEEAGTTGAVYQITSTATRGSAGSLERAERQLQAVLSKP